MWHWLWDRENCLGLLLPSCQNTFCSFLLCFAHTPFQSSPFLSLSLMLPLLLHSLSLAGSGRTGQRWEVGRQRSVYAAFVVEPRVRRSSQSICLTGQEVSDCCRSFWSRESVTCPLAEREKTANTLRPIRLWMQGCLPWSQVINFAWRSHRFGLNNISEATGQLPKSTRVRWWRWKWNGKQEQRSARNTLDWL